MCVDGGRDHEVGVVVDFVSERPCVLKGLNLPPGKEVARTLLYATMSALAGGHHRRYPGPIFRPSGDEE